MVNSKKKGSRGELEAAHYLTELLGIPFKRGQQFKGTAESPDIESDLKGIHWEVKRVEKLNVRIALEKAREEARPEQVPCVLHRPNGKPWMITIYADDLLRFVYVLCSGVVRLLNLARLFEEPNSLEINQEGACND